MHVRGLGTAVPATRYDKAQCLAALRASDWYERLDARAHFVARSVLERDNGIEYRHLAVDTIDRVFDIDADTLAARFAEHAPVLGSRAGKRALDDAGLNPQLIDAIVVSTCTGYLCPGLSGYIVERLGLRTDVQAFDLVGQGCAAAVPNLQLGHALIGAGTHRHVLSVCVEVCSAAMYLDSDPGVIISACLFGDGAGAAVLSADAGSGRCIRWRDSASLLVAEEREALRFEHRDGLLRNILTRRVPALASRHASELLEKVLVRAGLGIGDIDAWILHAGGRDVLQQLERRLSLSPDATAYSRTTLSQYGNLSSAFVYFVLQAALADDAPGGHWWLASFGAGFSCHGALLSVDS